MSCCGGAWESFWEGVESGKFKSYARGFAILNLLLMIAVPLICIITANFVPPLTFALLEVCGVLMGVIELPYCCACCDWCEKLKGIISVFENFILRGFMFVAFGTMLISVSHKVDHSAVGWTFGISVPINGCLYWIASCKGEKEGDSKEDKTSDKKAAAGAGDVEAPNTNSMESDADQAAGQGVLEQAAIAAAKDPKVQKAAIDAVKDNPGIALAAARAAARV
mmetsp:Transcript_45409/g.92762  ORF Transcript_45409/g.92762 Transcript_45409/m.92762 type:complete len:223 (-) Transcript_45409:1842-2510(-)